MRTANSYALEALQSGPNEESLVKALKAAGANYYYQRPEVAGQRAAFGRVLADLRDAGMLNNAPAEVEHLLRTTDLDLVGQVPTVRPSAIADPPEAGHNQTRERWLMEVDARLDEYIAAAIDEDTLLIGAESQVTVLNLDLPEEEFRCGAFAGGAIIAPDSHFLPDHSAHLRELMETPEVHSIDFAEPLIVQKRAETFQQTHSDWLAFRPDLASVLGWTHDFECPGRWLTSEGELVVETVW